MNLKLSTVVGYHTQARERATYIYGIRPSDGVRCAEDLSSGAVQDFLMRHPEVDTTPKIARCLAFIDTFAP